MSTKSKAANLSPICYGSSRKKNGQEILKAFADGSPAQLHIDHVYRTGRPAVFYGVTPDTLTTYRAAVRSGLDWYYIDHGYFGRGAYYRITRNAEQFTGRNARPAWDRLAEFRLAFADWRPDGDHILICTQSDWWHQRHHMLTAAEWGEAIKAKIAAHTNRPIKIRAKPEAAKGITAKAIAKTLDSLDSDLTGCHALVTHTSNAAIDALVRGVPVFVDPTSAAAPLGLTLDHLEVIETPRLLAAREEWFAVLAGQQWTVKEMRDGTAWAALQ